MSSDTPIQVIKTLRPQALNLTDRLLCEAGAWPIASLGTGPTDLGISKSPEFGALDLPSGNGLNLSPPSACTPNKCLKVNSSYHASCARDKAPLRVWKRLFRSALLQVKGSSKIKFPQVPQNVHILLPAWHLYEQEMRVGRLVDFKASAACHWDS